ncbi:hypothetical protein KGF36_18825 [Clostridioides sp. ZZV14-6009]|uniref:hypothetical protein n=1 Tax=unclassified Clostridioides TaxID=2635829 RepID=UPI001D1231F2|nr:hypothetical protein [Clostridioides sp. ZZV14-6009]MCC0743367.1 hypothetical protein [Clostridioides sp. ZZV14-6044]MCC0752710.1 hypothetical protein [Clostridioides sp. ZZV13-5731]
METREEKIKRLENILRENGELLGIVLLLSDMFLPKSELSKTQIARKEKCIEVIDLFMKLTPDFQDYALQQIKGLQNLQTSFIDEIRKNLR